MAEPPSLLISRQRYTGYLGALRKHGLPTAEELRTHSNFRTKSAVAALDAWLALPEPPDAIFAINCPNAFDLLLALKRHGLRVPAGVAIVDFSDEFLATPVEPGLTTVDLHPFRISQQAARLFLERMAQKEQFEPRTCIIPGKLIIRQLSLKSRS